MGNKMRSINELKRLGFTANPTANASGCTDIGFNAEFHYFNPKFLDDASKLVSSLKAADALDDGLYGIIVAGLYADSDVLPFVLLSADQVECIKSAHAQFEKAQIRRKAAAQKEIEASSTLTTLFELLKQSSDITKQ